MNRRHMTDDHHGPTVGRANPAGQGRGRRSRHAQSQSRHRRTQLPNEWPGARRGQRFRPSDPMTPARRHDASV